MPGSTKGQMQIMEIVIVLMIFFMILGFGTLFFMGFLKDKTNLELTETQALNLAETAKIVSSLPELHCSLRGDEDFTCLDIYRVEGFANQVRESDASRRHYADTFQSYKATISCIYPEGCADRLNGVTLFDYTRQGATNTVPFVLPVVIYDPITEEYAYGELELVQT